MNKYQVPKSKRISKCNICGKEAVITKGSEILCVACRYGKAVKVIRDLSNKKAKIKSREDKTVKVIGLCPYCKERNIQKKGIRAGKQRYVCMECGKNWTDILPGVRLGYEEIEKKTKPKLSKQDYKKIIEEAIRDRKSLKIKYKNRNREINPYAVNATYCTAYCTSAQGMRTFRLDRIQLIATGEAFKFDSSFKEDADEKIMSAPFYKPRY